VSHLSPDVRLANAMMNMRVEEAQRGAHIRGLLERAELGSTHLVPRQGSPLLLQVSQALVALGARLVHYGLPRYEPVSPPLTLARS
jgi:hypothetical protein